MATTSKYVVSIHLKKGSIHGGGLPNQSYVEIYLDATLLHTSAKSSPPHAFNQTFDLEFAGVHKRLIVFKVYKKRWTSSGFKVVGSIVLPVEDLLPHMDNGPFDKEMHIVANRKNLTLGGSLHLGLDIKEISAADEDDPHLPVIIPLVKSWAEDLLTTFTVFESSKVTTLVSVAMIVSLLYYLYLNLHAWDALSTDIDGFVAKAGRLEALLLQQQ
jgi:hypothetical protein